MNLTGKDKRYLRSLGNQLRPIVWIGKEGLSKAVLTSIEEAHTNEELIKVKILEIVDHDRKAIAAELDSVSGSRVAGMVGGTILLYRRHPEKPVLTLPSSEKTKEKITEKN